MNSRRWDLVATLSVILCNYNHGKYVGRALEAILSQSRPAEQVIVVDDGSTDDSVQIIGEWAARFPVIKFLQNEQNRGWHASSARALTVVSGDYIYSAAADDIVLPGFFEAVCRLLDQHPGVGIACTKVVAVTSAGDRISVDGYQHLPHAGAVSPAEYLRLCLDGESPTHSLSCATVYRREWLQRAGGWRKELGSWGDTFAIRVIGLQTGMAYAPVEGVAFTHSPGGMSQSTLQTPFKLLSILRRAAELMRSPEFAGVLPEGYATRWENAVVDEMALRPLQPAIDGYQAVQTVSRSVAANASWPVRMLLGLLRRCMTLLYLISHRVQFGVSRRNLLAQERQHLSSTAE
ncbi:MAG TPA: glycosyltransferase family A protein [Planctomycetaceae bacterium]|nr:glycosyltransferase family A protein [Planctomycetaceae bacterium]